MRAPKTYNREHEELKTAGGCFLMAFVLVLVFGVVVVVLLGVMWRLFRAAAGF
jgi:hypothetical protein